MGTLVVRASERGDEAISDSGEARWIWSVPRGGNGMEKGGGVIEELRSSETKGNKVGGGLRKRRLLANLFRLRGSWGGKKACYWFYF